MQKLKNDMGIGKTLHDLRKVAGLSQSELVREMQLKGCTLSRLTYSKMERNLYNIRISELVALKQIFGVEYNDFFIGLE